MRRSALPVLVVACIVVAAVLAWLVTQRVMRGTAEQAASGPTVAETRTPGDFTKLDVTGHLDLVVVQGPTPSVVVEVPEGEQRNVRTRVDNGTLEIKVGTHGWKGLGGERGLPRVVVTAPTYEAIAVAGTVRVASPALDVPSLRIAASGATTIKIDSLKAQSLRLAGSGAVKGELAGRVTDQSISLSGAGSIDAPQLVSETAKVSVSGAGKVVVNAEKSLRVSLSGAGSVEYLGNPDVKESVSGIGRVKRREGDPMPARARLQVA